MRLIHLYTRCIFISALACGRLILGGRGKRGEEDAKQKIRHVFFNYSFPRLFFFWNTGMNCHIPTNCMKKMACGPKRDSECWQVLILSGKKNVMGLCLPWCGSHKCICCVSADASWYQRFCDNYCIASIETTLITVVPVIDFCFRLTQIWFCIQRFFLFWLQQWIKPTSTISEFALSVCLFVLSLPSMKYFALGHLFPRCTLPWSFSYHGSHSLCIQEKGLVGTRSHGDHQLHNNSLVPTLWLNRQRTSDTGTEGGD